MSKDSKSTNVRGLFVTRVQQNPKLISGEGKARKRDPWRVELWFVWKCAKGNSIGKREESGTFENKGEREKKKRKSKASLLAINATLMVFEPTVPHFLCSFFWKKKHWAMFEKNPNLLKIHGIQNLEIRSSYLITSLKNIYN